MNATNRFHPLRMVALLLALLLGSVPLSAQDYTVNLNDTDIQELIKFVAEATGKTIVVDPSVKGKGHFLQAGVRRGVVRTVPVDS